MPMQERSRTIEVYAGMIPLRFMNNPALRDPNHSVCQANEVSRSHNIIANLTRNVCTGVVFRVFAQPRRGICWGCHT